MKRGLDSWLTHHAIKVYLITGGSSGIGLELARILYWKNARVYIAGRSQASFDQAVENINKTPALGSSGTSKGALAFFHMDLSDLTTIKPAVDELLKKEVTLWSVWYNAGVMVPPKGSKTQQVIASVIDLISNRG